MKRIGIFLALGLTSCGLSQQQKEQTRAIAREESKRAVDAEFAAEARRRKAAFDAEEGRIGAQIESQADDAVAAATEAVSRAARH